MVYKDFKDVLTRKTSGKVFCDKAFNTTKIQKYDGYQRGLAAIISWLISSGANISGGAIIQHQQLAEVLHKSITGKFEK